MIFVLFKSVPISSESINVISPNDHFVVRSTNYAIKSHSKHNGWSICERHKECVFCSHKFFRCQTKFISSTTTRNVATTTRTTYKPINVHGMCRRDTAERIMVLLYIVISRMHAVTTLGMYYMNINGFCAKLCFFLFRSPCRSHLTP